MRYLPLLALIILLAACAKEGPTCTAPYIVNGQTCCLDNDADGACDAKSTTVADCSLCPPQFVTQKEQVIVYRYVCENQSIVDTAVECGKKVVSIANLFTPNQEQDAAYVRGFAVRPACRGNFNAAELHLTTAQQPTSITFQVTDDPTMNFRDIGVIDGAPDVFYYIGFCKDCGKLVNAELPSGAYLVRAMLTYPEKKVYTREFIVDTAGDFGTKTC